MFSSGNQRAKRCQGKPNMIDQDFHPQWIVRSFEEAIIRGMGVYQFGFTFKFKSIKNNQAAIPNCSLGKTSIEKMFSFGHSGGGMGYIFFLGHTQVIYLGSKALHIIGVWDSKIIGTMHF